MAPQGEAGKALEEIGCRRIPWVLSRKGVSPWKELRSAIELFRIYRQWRPTLVHHFTIKPNLYGTLSSYLARVPIRIASVTGLGYIWAEKDRKTRLARTFMTSLYRSILRLSTVSIFLNEDDRKLLGRSNSRIGPGEGIDVQRFVPSLLTTDQAKAVRDSLGIPMDSQVVMYVGRMLWHKGVKEFVASAAAVRRRRDRCRFVLVGPLDSGNPSSIDAAVIRSWQEQGMIDYAHERDDIQNVMSIADIVVLPSYREGLPVVLMEAAALGKPLVAADVAGCREIVRDGVNGFLAPVRDAEKLAAAIEKLLVDEELRLRFSAESRKAAEERFAGHLAVTGMLDLYDRLLERAHLAAILRV